MANIVPPKLSDVGRESNIKIYAYGGSTTKMGDKSIYADYENINYNNHNAVTSNIVDKKVIIYQNQLKQQLILRKSMQTLIILEQQVQNQ